MSHLYPLIKFLNIYLHITCLNLAICMIYCFGDKYIIKRVQLTVGIRFFQKCIQNHYSKMHANFHYIYNSHWRDILEKIKIYPLNLDTYISHKSSQFKVLYLLYYLRYKDSSFLKK